MDNIKYWIALEQCQGMGPAHLEEIYKDLNEKNLSIMDLIELNHNEIKEEFSFKDKIVDIIIESKKMLPNVEKDYFNLLDSGIEIIPFFSKKYPQRLINTMGHSAPPFLYLTGNSDILKTNGVAIIGDKFVSAKGELITYTAAKELSRHNLATISGFASGVDMIAHKSAIENHGTTIAFLPYGILDFKLNDYIKDIYDPEKMLIISSFYPNKEINKFNAFIRNKIICAMSLVVYIVEAPIEGGVFEAAKSANKLNVPLFSTEYSSYPENAKGNKIILEEMNGIPVRGKMENDLLIPNMEKIIGFAKFK